VAVEVPALGLLAPAEQVGAALVPQLVAQQQPQGAQTRAGAGAVLTAQAALAVPVLLFLLCQPVQL
jgi:hypothetical protein